ncbi:Cytochrome P450 4V2 [Chamberlinius hualienensis]
MQTVTVFLLIAFVIYSNARAQRLNQDSRPTKDDVCRLPKEVGSCQKLVDSSFYNSKTGECERFTYSGCDGNKNRFNSLEECRKRCVNFPLARDDSDLPRDLHPFKSMKMRTENNTTDMLSILRLCFPFLFPKNKRKKTLEILPTSKKRPTSKGKCLMASKEKQTGMLYDEIHEAINEFSSEPLVCVWIEKVPWVFITNPSVVQQLYNDPDGVLLMLGQPIAFCPYAKYFPKGLLAANHLLLWKDCRFRYFGKFQGNRRVELLQPTNRRDAVISEDIINFDKFTEKNFIDGLGIAQENARIMFHCLKKEFWRDGIPFDFYPYISRCIMDTFLEIFIGCPANIQLSDNRELCDAILELTNYFPTDLEDTTENRWFKSREEQQLKNAAGILREFVQQKLNIYKEALKSLILDGHLRLTREMFQDMTRRYSLLEFLTYSMLNKYNLIELNLLGPDSRGRAEADYEAEIVDQTIQLFLVGFGTTASATFWTLYNIAQFKNIHDEIRRNIECSFGNTASITFFPVTKLRSCLLEYTIKETLRLYPPVPFFARVLKEDFRIDEKVIPKDTVLAVSILHIHTSNAYENPFKFVPSRFNSNAARPPKGAYIPFGYGFRDCIGERLSQAIVKTVIAHILHRFKVSLYLDAGEEFKSSYNFFLKPISGHRMKLNFDRFFL